MVLPWIHHWADLAQKLIQMCGSHGYSQMLVDNCYAFGLLLQHSTLKEKFFGEGAPNWPIMALPWIHHWADLAQKSIQMCGSHEYSQMLVDNCYAFGLLLQHSTLKEMFFGEGTLIDPLVPCPESASGRIWPKNEYKWAGSWVLYPTKFSEYPSSDSVVKADYVFPYIYMH